MMAATPPLKKDRLLLLLIQSTPGLALWLLWQTAREIMPRVFVSVSAALLASVLVWPVALAAIWDHVASLVGRWEVRLVATLICGVIGALLYITRQTMRMLYGIAEILVGIAACWVAIGQSSKSGIEGAIALGSGLYIIVRGFDNCGKAKEDKAKAEEEKEKQKEAAQQKAAQQQAAQQQAAKQQETSEFLKRLVSPYAMAPENPFAKFLAEAQRAKK